MAGYTESLYIYEDIPVLINLSATVIKFSKFIFFVVFNLLRSLELAFFGPLFPRIYENLQPPLH